MLFKRQNKYNRKTNQVKFCGFLHSSQVLKTCQLKVDYIGFNFFAKSPRYVSLSASLRLLKKANFENLNRRKNRKTKAVAVLVDPSFRQVQKIIQSKKFKILQFHGKENLRFIQKIYRYLKSSKNTFVKEIEIWKVFSLRGQSESEIRRHLKQYNRFCTKFILDVLKQKDYKQGIKEFSEFDLFKSLAKDYKLILAGGLKPENITNIIKKSKAKEVDIASGVELRPGVKDFSRVRKVIAQLKPPQLHCL